MDITIKNCQGVTLLFSPIGATWLSCLLPLVEGYPREVLLRCLDPQNNRNAFIGSTIGRYSNRIKNSLIERNQKDYQLHANQGPHQLHGGDSGFHSLTWQVINQQPNRVIFGLNSSDNDQGFPGEVKATVDYFLTENNQVVINYIATTDKPTPINLTNHAYFNLDGCGTILNHELSVDADYYLPVDKNGIPIAELVSVDHNEMDLRTLKPIHNNLLKGKDKQQSNGYDHAYFLNKQSRELKVPAAKLISSDKKVMLDVFTNKPAIQVYTGNNLNGVKGRNEIFETYRGIALETEFLPDSPNRPDWPHESSWIDPEQYYCYTTIYQFYF